MGKLVEGIYDINVFNPEQESDEKWLNVVYRKKMLGALKKYQLISYVVQYDKYQTLYLSCSDNLFLISIVGIFFFLLLYSVFKNKGYLTVEHC